MELKKAVEDALTEHLNAYCTVKELKHKFRQYTTYLKAVGLDYPTACPRKELHQFLIELHGDYIIPSTLY